MKKLKWHGILFALFMLFIYIMGTYDLFMMLSHNEAYYLNKGYGESIHNYFTDYHAPGISRSCSGKGGNKAQICHLNSGAKSTGKQVWNCALFCPNKK